MMVRFYGYKNIPFDKPRYKRVETLPFIPLESEVQNLISGVGKKTTTFLQLIKETGCRPGEAWNLRWIDIDVEKSTESLTEYQTHSQQSVFLAYSVYYSTLGSEHLEKACTEWNKQVLCSVGDYATVFPAAETYCMAVNIQNMGAGSCVVVDEGIVSTVFVTSAISTLTNSYTVGIAETSSTIVSTTIPFTTLSTNVPPDYVSAFGINQIEFTYLAFFAIIGAVALAIIIAYPTKSKSQSSPPKNLQ